MSSLTIDQDPTIFLEQEGHHKQRPDEEIISLFDIDNDPVVHVNGVREVYLRDGEQKILVIFCADSVEKKTHWVRIDGRNTNIQCNGEGCTLCKVNMSVVEFRLLPVYDPLIKEVQVLRFVKRKQPGDLMPQVQNAITNGRRLPLLMYVTRIGYAYQASFKVPRDDQDMGIACTDAFMAAYKNKQFRLSDIIETVSNEFLAGLPEIMTRHEFIC